jgi:MFS family permease
MARIRLLFILNGIAVAAFGPFAAVILESRGFEATQIGLLIAMTSVAAVLSITVWGHVGDVVLGRARTLRIAIPGRPPPRCSCSRSRS